MPLALFDLDNTLIAGDSDYAWGQFLVREQKVDPAYYESMNERFYADYQAGCLDMKAYLEFALKPLRDIPLSELYLLRARFVKEVIAPMDLPAARSLIDRHRIADDRLLIITSTNRFIVEPICHSLGISEIIATEPETIDGNYTGCIDGVPAYREGKVLRLKDWLALTGETLQGSFFYSDSHNDLPLLVEVDNPVAVDPDEQLRQEAVRRGWKIISLRD